MHTIHVISFGFLHSPAPTADLVLDTRRYPHDPITLHDNGLLDADGRDDAVQQLVLATLGAEDALDTTHRFATTFPTGQPCTIAIGCAGGRHRSVALVELLAHRLHTTDVLVHVEHRHVHLPRMIDSTVSTAAVERERYRERALLLFALSTHPEIQGAVLTEDPDAEREDCTTVLLLDTCTGPMRWHLHDADVGLFGHLERVSPEQHPDVRWDGTDKSLVLERLWLLGDTAVYRQAADGADR